MRRIDCHDRIKHMKRSYDTALKSVDVLLGLVASRPEYLNRYGLDPNEMQNLSKGGLHDVYFATMFACFESSIRHFWRTSVRNSRPGTEQLLNLVAGRRGVPQDVLDTVHEIRDFRNYLIHGDNQIKKRFTIDEASSALNTFVARLPLQW